MDRAIIDFCKYSIEQNDLMGIQNYFANLQQMEFDYRLPWEYMFKTIYIHACVKKNESIANWLQDSVYPMMNEVSQIGLRQVFCYGRYLLRK